MFAQRVMKLWSNGVMEVWRNVVTAGLLVPRCRMFVAPYPSLDRGDD